jgi:DNA-binding NarL/FixJ family response regulator
VRAGLRSVVVTEDCLELVGESSTLDESLRELRSQVDVVLLGIRDLSKTGVGDIEKLNEMCPDAATVVFTTSRNEPYLMQALLAGARGYLLSDSGHQEIVNAVKSANQGKSVQAPACMLLSVLKGLPWSSSNGSASNTMGSTARLTARETEILQEMGTGVTYRTIAEKLFLAESTVKKYAHSVITKLGASNRATAVVTAHRLNLLVDKVEDSPVSNGCYG